ncbi:type II toxin-antitoxin system PemK/MazF family toxin [Sulfurimonas sediminis]|uniref:Type II toxin-antitoxin system PemK/MazF family toxin n=1 Tax=Sulfurimonas sediminis TaxID=2590020 RepID=A0A7M1B567_9BACT|nr:type II toxin-antitoxin system PemK/MazF family toxin [Sulfurimonas sediminis]QOP43842.1 type II toxin-antitoxin system PemK/MazF family toxin [Sulfurimonas sediminis]
MQNWALMMDSNSNYKRGDIVVVNLNPKKGHEVGKIKPAVIISGEDENSILILFILMPLSTDLIEDMSPYRIRITQRDKLQQDSDILINQVRSLSKQRIGKKIATLTKNEYELVIQSLCKNFTS